MGVHFILCSLRVGFNFRTYNRTIGIWLRLEVGYFVRSNIIFLKIMDPKHTGEMLRHLEKQDELLMDAYRSMSHELHKLQVEEEMLMRSFYRLMEAQGLTKKKQDGKDVSGESEPTESKVLVTVDDVEKQ
ncbi:hypothetical protein L1987_60541 [Smallanthus sonchifolius]|uniref:Uncharacterized protein n=1 Tax=Smallanthus sonchifolius TaxID=185202 RepID=A0ACB9D8G9_9ASTR|nr:hypothetical protein L1987_60541 [Smallanthus sonchifolius]